MQRPPRVDKEALAGIHHSARKVEAIAAKAPPAAAAAKPSMVCAAGEMQGQGMPVALLRTLPLCGRLRRILGFTDRCAPPQRKEILARMSMAAMPRRWGTPSRVVDVGAVSQVQRLALDGAT